VTTSCTLLISVFPYSSHLVSAKWYQVNKGNCEPLGTKAPTSLTDLIATSQDWVFRSELCIVLAIGNATVGDTAVGDSTIGLAMVWREGLVDLLAEAGAVTIGITASDASVTTMSLGSACTITLGSAEVLTTSVAVSALVATLTLKVGGAVS
jgi:hypothetical protein